MRNLTVGKNWKQGWPELAGLLRFDLPRFTYGKELGEDEIPVFSFHKTDPRQLRYLLEHLSRNRYATITLDQLADHLSEKCLCANKSVVLTFDDGWASAWMVATPLLKRFRMRATVFIPPALIKDAPSARRTLDDGLAESAAVDQESVLDTCLITWPEICAMQQSGVWDIQSHTLTHGRVWDSDKVRDFCHPQAKHDVLTMGPSTLLVDDSPEGRFTAPPYLGLPLYGASPRMDAARRFVPHPDEKRHLADYVKNRGGTAFFGNPGWEKQLFQTLYDFRKAWPGHWETEEECRAAIRNELLEARRLIELKTGHSVHHLLFPWERGNSLAVEIARETGHRTALFGVVRGRRTNRPGNDPFKIPRLSWKFIPLLPGNGRQRLATNLLARVRRRLRPGSMRGPQTTNEQDTKE